MRKNQNGDFQLFQYQILRTNVMRIEWKTVGRIINKILRVKGLGVQSRSEAQVQLLNA